MTFVCVWTSVLILLGLWIIAYLFCLLLLYINQCLVFLLTLWSFAYFGPSFFPYSFFENNADDWNVVALYICECATMGLWALWYAQVQVLCILLGSPFHRSIFLCPTTYVYIWGILFELFLSFSRICRWLKCRGTICMWMCYDGIVSLVICTSPGTVHPTWLTVPS